MPNRSPKKPDTDQIKNLALDPDAWPKFEKLIKSAAKMGPKPHAATLGLAKKPRRK
jgi:hypothetical protein